MTARYNVVPQGVIAADISFTKEGKPLLAVVTKYANALSVFELIGDRNAMLVVSPSCTARALLEPTVRVLTVRANPFTPAGYTQAQFLLLTVDGASRLV